jgi:hypothetical protein
MIAFESLNPSNRYLSVVIMFQWGDDKPGLYAVPKAEMHRHIDGARAQGARVCVLDDKAAFAHFDRGEWIGIKLVSLNGVAAWGRATLEG